VDLALYSTIWLALALFALAEAGKRQWFDRGTAPAWAWPAWVLGAGLCTVHITLAFAARHHWSHASAVRETARQTAEVYGVAWGGGVYVNYVFLAAWWAEAWWWRIYPVHYFGRRPSITWVLRGFYAVILVNAAIVFASVERRALGVLLVVALGWTWRPTRAAAVAIRQVGSR
jgi:hypothetical protein